MKTILVPTQHIATMKSALELAVLLARRTSAYIEGFPLRIAIPPYVVAELTAGLTMDAYDAQRDEEMAELRRTFESFMQEHDVPTSGTPGNRPCYGWLAAAPEDESFIGNHGRAFDITVISRLDAESTGLHRRAIESALFESGRPVLLAPPVPGRQLGTNALIAWNCSTEQARTMADAMPFLKEAVRVTICTVEGATVAGPSGEQMAHSLKMNGIAAEPITLKAGKRNAGETLLAKAEELGCDLIVKGAYTQSRLRQMIFGGTTRHIHANAKLPMLMAH